MSCWGVGTRALMLMKRADEACFGSARKACAATAKTKNKCSAKRGIVIVQDVRVVFYFVGSCIVDSMALLEVVHRSSEGARLGPFFCRNTFFFFFSKLTIPGVTGLLL